MATTPFPDLDRWSHLDHRIGTPDDLNLSLAPGWLPQDQWRRLNAYRFLDAVNKNSSRWYMEADTDRQRDRFREFGDANLFADRLAAGVVGDQIDVLVDGAEHEPSETPPVPEPPVRPDNGDPADLAAYDAAMRQRAVRSEELIDEWEAQWASYPGLTEAQRWIRDWAHRDHFAAKVYEMEASNIVPLGDGVATILWDSKAQQPTMTLYPPDAYFPVLDDLDDGQFPEKVHLAWEYVEENRLGQEETWVRRITYELVPTEQPWQTAYSDEPADKVCVVSDGRWMIDQFKDRTIMDLSDANAVWTLNQDDDPMQQLPLLIDFIPVVHIPNGFANLEHFGQSALAPGIQVLQAIAQADTDAAKAAELAGTPQIAVSGATGASELVLGEAVAWQLSDGGRMDVLDQSASLSAITDYQKLLQERGERIMKVPAGVLGRNANREIRSGVALQISNFPYDQEIGKLRLTRAPKYRLLLKMVQRIGMVGGNGPPQVVPARISFGSHLPSDLATAVSNVTTLLNSHAISRATGLRMLIDAGADVDSVESELARIMSEDTSAAVNVFNATGSAELASQSLGRDLPEDALEPEEPVEAPSE